MAAIAIRTEGLSKRYRAFEALHDLDLEVAQGEVVGYLGPNGAGKTTTIRLLLGMIRPTKGYAEIFGLDCQRPVSYTHLDVYKRQGAAHGMGVADHLRRSTRLSSGF